MFLTANVVAQEPDSTTPENEATTNAVDSTTEAIAADSNQGVIDVDHIVAIVNEEVITQLELEDAIQAAISQLQQQGVQPPDQALMEKQILEGIIVKRIQLQRAKEMDLAISESELDDTIQRIAEENEMTVQAFYAALEQDKINFNTFRNEIRNEIIMMRLKERVIKDRVNITEGEVDNFLRTQETSAVGSDEYRMAHILVLVPERADVIQIEEKRKRAEEALTKLKDGVEFSQVAAEFSDSADAMRGGVLEWRPVAQMGATFAELLSGLQQDELTRVIQSPTGFHIFKLLGRRAQEVPVVIVSQTRARHILVKVSELTSESDAQQRIIELKASIDKGADFQEIAKLHSEDGSAASGGDLGWVSPGDTVPDFEQAMNALQPGQISEPVQSPFGWHLIQVVERREEDVSQQRQRQAARQAIKARKSEVVVQNWLRQMRDMAYVEYVIEDNPLN